MEVIVMMMVMVMARGAYPDVELRQLDLALGLSAVRPGEIIGLHKRRRIRNRREQIGIGRCLQSLLRRAPRLWLPVRQQRQAVQPFSDPCTSSSKRGPRLVPDRENAGRNTSFL